MNTTAGQRDPILFYYCPIKRAGDIAYINLLLVINDKLSGKLLPEQYLAVAERATRRMEKLNIFMLQRVKKEIEKNPERVFIIYLSPKMLKSANLSRVLDIVTQKESNVIFALQKILLDSLGERGREGIAKLRASGVRIMLDGVEQCSVKSLAEIQADFIRLDARHYGENNILLLRLIDTVCKEKDIRLVGKNADTAGQADFFTKNGIELLEGRAIAKPVRYLKNLYSY